MENDPERAGGYLLALHDELESLGRWPPSLLPTIIFLLIGGAWFGSGLVSLFMGEVVASLPWAVVGSVVLFPGLVFGRRTLEWFRQVRSLRRGIELIEGRQRKRVGSEAGAAGILLFALAGVAISPTLIPAQVPPPRLDTIPGARPDLGQRHPIRPAPPFYRMAALVSLGSLAGSVSGALMGEGLGWDGGFTNPPPR